jgi:hypothetical protein
MSIHNPEPLNQGPKRLISDRYGFFVIPDINLLQIHLLQIHLLQINK